MEHPVESVLLCNYDVLVVKGEMNNTNALWLPSACYHTLKSLAAIDAYLPGLEAGFVHWNSSSIVVETIGEHRVWECRKGMFACLNTSYVALFTFDGGFGLITTANLSPSLISLA